MVIAQHKQPLLAQIKVCRELSQVNQDRFDQPIRDVTVLGFGDVVLRQTQQLRENSPWRRRSRTKVAVTNRGV